MGETRVEGTRGLTKTRADVPGAVAGFRGCFDDMGRVSRESRAEGVRAAVEDVRCDDAAGEGRGWGAGDDAREVGARFAR